MKDVADYENVSLRRLVFAGSAWLAGIALLVAASPTPATSFPSLIGKVLVVLFYLAAAGLGWGFNALSIALGLNPAGSVSPSAIHYGVSLANVLTLMMVVLMISGSLLTVAERKWSALLQNRVGANRIKVFGNPLGGIPYLAADALKMLTKERIEPARATHLLYELAPMMALAPVFCLFAIVPVGPPVDLGAYFDGAVGAGQTVALQVAKMDAGLLYLFAIASRIVAMSFCEPRS